MTPVCCCGFECGQIGGTTAPHWISSGGASISTGTVRSGARSLRLFDNAGVQASAATQVNPATHHVGRIYWYPASFASAYGSDSSIFVFVNIDYSGVNPGISYNVADGKVYTTFSVTSGVSVTTGTWYRIDWKYDNTNQTLDVAINGASLAQLTGLTGSTPQFTLASGIIATGSSEYFFDDLVYSETLADYPIGAGYVNHFVPTADGTHNVAGANDFERSATGTDITNATTTAFQLVDDVPIEDPAGAPTDFINAIAPPNATDYVEIVFGPASGISTPTVAPRAVEVITGYAAGATSPGTNNLRLALNDNGSLDDVFNGQTQATTSVRYARKHYVDPPSAASVWTLSGNGNFNNVRMRCFTSDATPDPYFACAMIEAEFAEVSSDSQEWRGCVPSRGFTFSPNLMYSPCH